MSRRTSAHVSTMEHFYVVFRDIPVNRAACAVYENMPCSMRFRVQIQFLSFLDSRLWVVLGGLCGGGRSTCTGCFSDQFSQHFLFVDPGRKLRELPSDTDLHYSVP